MDDKTLQYSPKFLYISNKQTLNSHLTSKIFVIDGLPNLLWYGRSSVFGVQELHYESIGHPG